VDRPVVKAEVPDPGSPQDRRAALRKQNSEEIRGRILAAGADLFRRKGFQGTNTQDIADAVGIVKGTLYYYMPSKEDLLFQIWKHVNGEGGRVRDAILAKRLSPRATLIQLVESRCRMVDRYGDALAVIAEELKFLSEERLAIVMEGRDTYAAQLEQVISDGVAAGQFATTDVRLASLSVLSLLNGLYAWYQPGGRLSADEIGKLSSALILDGILSKPAKRSRNAAN
jgi:AcrR family transcriptional regulator